jgi:[ribosomal protein S18]-alanine N-acetyltransferase
MIFARRRPTRSVLRPLRAAQAADCARIHAQGFAFSWAQSELESLISSPNVAGTAALDPANARLRGFALSRLAADEAEILTVAIDANLRRGGVGRDLLHSHLNQVAAAGAKEIFLEVDADNAAALALYKRFQFVRVGERRGYYARQYGEPATALVMRRDLT